MKSYTEQAVVLGLLTVLGATGELWSAVAAAGTVLLAGLVVGLVECLGRGLPRIGAAWDGSVRWGVLTGAGFAVSWLCGAVAPFYVPLPESVARWIQWSGLTPIVLVAAARPARETVRLLGVFLCVVLITAAIREGFGNGTLGGRLTPMGFITPSAIFRTPVGAFLLAGAWVLAARCRLRRRMDGEELNLA